jgi:hypothetical protein
VKPDCSGSLLAFLVFLGRHDVEVTDVLVKSSRHKRAPGGASLEVAQRASTAPGILSQYPRSRFPHTSISRNALPKSSSATTVTSRNSRRHASSGRSPVLNCKEHSAVSRWLAAFGDCWLASYEFGIPGSSCGNLRNAEVPEKRNQVNARPPVLAIHALLVALSRRDDVVLAPIMFRHFAKGLFALDFSGAKFSAKP